MEFLWVLVLYGFLAIFIWLIVIQINMNKLNDKLRKLLPEEKKEIPENIEIQEQSEKSYENVSIDKLIKENEKKISELAQNADKENKSKSKSSLEEKFFGNIFNKIGALAIIIALCILIKIVSPFIVFTNEMKIALGFITGLGLIFASFKIQKDEKMKKFTEVLMGTGFGAVLITIYFGAGILNMFSAPVAVILAILTTLSMYFIADKQKTTSMIVLALIGGYLNPFFVNYHITMNFLCGYLIFLNLLSIIYVYRNCSKDIINIINLILSSICIICCSLSITDEMSLWHILSLWGLYIVYDILCINKEGFHKTKPLRYVNFSILTILSLLIYRSWDEIGIFLYLVSTIYAILGVIYLYKTQERENEYFISCIISSFLTIFFFTKNDDLLRITLWALEGLIVAFFAFKFKLKVLSRYVGIIYTAVLCKLFISPDIYDTKYETPILNDRILYFLAPIISGGIISYGAKKINELKTFEIFKFISISLIYVYLILEINSIFIESSYYITILAYIIPTVMFIYAINLNILSKYIQIKPLFLAAKNLILWTGIIWLFFADEIYATSNNELLPLLNLRLVAYLFLLRNILYELKQKEIEWKKYLAVILGFLYIHYESVNTINYFSNIDWLISVMWVLYSGIISLIGIFKNKKFLKISGIWLSIITVIRLFFYDLATLDMVYKLIALITLGAVLLIISYIYNKKKQL